MYDCDFDDIDQNNKLIRACKIAADELEMEVNVFMGLVYDKMQKVYDREDIISWLDNEEYEYDDDDVDYILSVYRSKYDCDRGTWSNIESAYYYTGLNLQQIDEDE